MAQFVWCNTGRVNLDHVTRVKAREDDGQKVHDPFDPAGKLLGVALNLNPDIDLQPIVPAAPRTIVAVVGAGFRDDGGVYSWDEVVPVVAWRVCQGYCEPILLETPASNEMVLHPLPNASWHCVGGATFPHLDDAKSSAIEELLREQKAGGAS